MDNIYDMVTSRLTSSRIGMLVGSGGVMLAVTSFIGLSGKSLLIVAGGMLLVAAVFCLFLLLMKVRAKQKFAAGDEAIQDEMRKRPRKMNNPEALAKVADLSKRFERGVSLYRQATGQRLSECPWYLFTGTPGSGKTEAIRHCGIGMPDGLHEEQQGAGGTVNMDWWFTDDAIILDTAGRYLTDVDSTAEWEEFLKLLNRARPDAPINGMLVALPADSLLKDSGDEVQRKGTEIAKFLDRVRRTLGVRFPVFIVVTKSDLIPGFREFFSHVADSELQAQIVGWSKPGDLDDAFDPDEVEHYLQTLRDTLIRRRMGLLVDPIHTEDVSGRRLDQVDALYMFPDSLLGIGPRLQRYLQMVFVKSKFNQNPLFLRGIYFTQAFEEGAALDEALARIRNVSLEQLEAEGRGWRRDRALFLRDLFERKVFQENGLVTRASNTGQLKRKRAMTLIGAGFAAVAVLGVFVYFFYQKLGHAISNETEFWNSVKNQQVAKSRQLDLLDLVAAPANGAQLANFAGTKSVGAPKRNLSAADFFGGDAADGVIRISSDVEIPRFYTLLPFKNSFNSDRKQAFQVLFDQHVLLPLIQGTCARFITATPPPTTSDDTTWNKDGAGTKALVELLKLESLYNGGTVSEPVKLAALLQYLQPTPMPEEDTISKLQAMFDAMYPASSSQLPDYKITLKQALIPVHDAMDTASKSGTYVCIQYWSDRRIHAKPIARAADAINAFQGWRDLVEAPNYFAGEVQPPRTADDYVHKYQQWNDWWEPASRAYAALNTFLKSYPEEKDSWKKGGKLSLEENYHTQVNSQTALAKDVFDKCQTGITPSTGGLTEPLGKIKASLIAASVVPPLEPAQVSLIQDAEACDKWGAIPYPDKNKKTHLAYEIVSDLCDQATSLLPASVNDAIDAAGIQDLVSKGEALAAAQKEAFAQVTPDSSVAEPGLKAIGNLSSFLISPATTYIKVKYDLDTYPSKQKQFDDQVASQVDTSQQKTYALPLAANPSLDLEPRYNAEAFSDQINKWYDIKDQIDPPTTGSTKPPAAPVALLTSLKKSCLLRQNFINEMVNHYYYYWETVDNDILPNKESAHIHRWDDIPRQIKHDLNPDEINGNLVELYTTQTTALKKQFRNSLDHGVPAVAAVKRLTALIEHCSSSDASYGSEGCVVKWRKLANDNSAVEAQKIILDMKPDDFAKEYLSVDAVPYWDRIATLAVETLTREVHGNVKQKLDDFAQSCKKYPVDALQSPLDAIKSAEEAQTILDKLPSNIFDNTFAPDSIGGGRVVHDDKIDPYLNDLRISTLSPELKLQKRILASLVASNQNAKITFLQRDEGAKVSGTVAGKYKEPDRTWQAVSIREWENDPAHPGRDLPPNADLTYAYNGTHRCGSKMQDNCDPFPQHLSGLTVLFRDNMKRSRIVPDNNGQPTNARQYAGPWPFITMILDPATIATSTANGSIWTIEIPDPQQDASVLMQVEFPGASYPNVAEWPR